MLPSSETSLGSTQNSVPNPARSNALAFRDGTPHGLLITSPSVMESSRRPPRVSHGRSRGTRLASQARRAMTRPMEASASTPTPLGITPR